MPSVEQPASLPDPPSQAEGPREAGGRDAATCPTVRARSILQKVRYDGDEWFGLDYNMNLYRGCAHGCIYCDSRSECYRIDGFDQVRAKFDALSILRRELRSRRVRGIVGVGAMSDTYNPFECTLQVTRGALELIEEFGFGVSVDTKSTLVTRDIDLLQTIGAAGGAIAKITITTADDHLARLIEPHAPLPSERFAALAELAEAGVFCGVLFTPTLPPCAPSWRARRPRVRTSSTTPPA